MIRYMRFLADHLFLPTALVEDLERIREKHEDSDFGMSFGDQLDREERPFDEDED